MTHRKLNRLLQGIVIGLAVPTFAIAATWMTSSEYRAAKDRAAAEYKAAKSQCDGLKDNAKDVDRRPVWPSTRPDANAMFGSNDRSRWATIRALVHDHTYVIGKREQPIIRQSAIALFGATNDARDLR